MRESILLYKSQCDALRHLPPEQFKAAVVAIWDYGMEDKEPPDGDPIAVAMVGMARPLIDKNNRNYENGKRGGRKSNQSETEPNRMETEPNRTETESEPTCNPNVKCKRRNIKEISPKGDTKKKTTTPTLEEIQEYIKERGSDVDAQHFFDYYASQKWRKANGQPVSDWKACVRTWERNQRQGTTAEGQRQGLTAETKFSNFPQREYDWNNIEQEMLKGAL